MPAKGNGTTATPRQRKTAASTNGDHDFDHTDIPTREQVAEEHALGHLGKPLNHRNPFYIGLAGAFGVAVAYVGFKAVSDIGTILQLIGLSLFLAIGLDPAVVWLTKRRLPRWGAVVIVVLVLVGVIALFVTAAVGPISRQIHELQVNSPKWRAQAESGKGWLGHLVKEFHLTSQLKSGKLSKTLSASNVAGGVVGAGKIVVTAVTATVVVCVLTVYFLVALPAVRGFWLRLMPQSRRVRVAAMSDEVLSRVGGFVLGNVLTSVVAGLGTWVWLIIFGVPYPLLLALLVAILDLIPMVGSTIAGIIVAAVALTVSVPVAVATLAFYIAYRFFEDYLLTPRVMRHTVRISPGLTIIATLIGGVLLGLIGALIAIPVAAGIHLILEEVTFPSLERR
jgi:predicted PurR-regulated permease PerM